MVDPAGSCKQLFGHTFLTHSSLQHVRMKHATKEALIHFIAGEHNTDSTAEVLLRVDGGGKRKSKTEELPATWAVVVSTVGKDGTYAFKHFFGGQVVTDRDDERFLGAQQETSMTAETTAQAMAGLYALANPLGPSEAVPITIVYDNEVAAKFAKSAADTVTSRGLHAAAGSICQIAAMPRNLTWAHAYSH